MYTPWGESQHVEHIADGIVSVDTASHGGIRLSAERIKQLPASALTAVFNKSGVWWEEDCDWCIPWLVFEKEFRFYYEAKGDPWLERNVEAAKQLASIYHPAFYAEWLRRESQLSLFPA